MLRSGLAALALCAIVTLPLAGQSSGLRSQINSLFTFGDCGEPLCLDGSSLNGHGDHFLPAAAFGNFAVINFLTDAVGASVSSLPVSATSSGTTFTFVGGVPVKTSSSAGPIFGERAQTLGSGRVFAGMNITGLSYSRLRGVPLDNLEFNFTHQDIGNPGLGDPEFENDVISVRMDLNVRLVVTSFFFTVGVLDFADLGVVVPVVRSSLEGRSTAQVNPFGSSTVLHRFGGDAANPILRAAAATNGSATGVGDISARLKVNLGQSQKFGSAILLDAQFPTGREEDLLGSGEAAARALGIVSFRFGDFSPHLNAGYLFRGGSNQNDAVLGTVGFDHLLGPWATLAADFISEWQVGSNLFVLPEPVVYTVPFTRIVEPTTIPNRRDHRLSGALGMKFTTSRGVTLIANALVPLGSGGLQPGIVWTGGLEYVF